MILLYRGDYVAKRGKSKHKRILKLKRKEKLKAGKLVRFDLQNSPKKCKGIKNKYYYQTNIHNLIYKGAAFENVRYQASNITKCNYREASLTGVDFCNSNLKNSDFRNSKLKNVIFFNCNLKNCDFEGTKMEDVYFICTNINSAKNLILNSKCEVITTYPKLNLSKRMNENINALAGIYNIFKPHVIHVTENKPNFWIIKILLDYVDESNLERCFYALQKRKDTRNFCSMFAYKQFIDSYLKR